MKGAILLATGPWPIVPWAETIRAGDPDRALYLWPDLPDPAAIRYALVWKPPEGILKGLTRLAVVFSLGAGVDHLVFQHRLPGVPIVRIVSPDLTRRMAEWVVLQVLIHHRRQRTYDAFQARRHWQDIEQPAASAVRVGVMGMGVLGRHSADILARLGFQVAGWSRRPSSVAGVEAFHGADGLDPFLTRTDILVCLLPHTPETHGILAMPLFGKLARDGVLGGPVLINAGRGGLQVEADIVKAIEAGVLAGASLDVFEKEPLDATSRLWALPNVVITPHVAADSEPATIIPQILTQIASFEDGRPLTDVIDRASLY
ncbi:MAG: glyoxylate/hydroxypyruvate reductase A [Bauldia sp.]